MTGHLEEVELELEGDGHARSVLSCTAFNPPELVRCEEACLRMLNERGEREPRVDDE